MTTNLPAIQWGLIAGIKDYIDGCRVVHTTDPFSIPANTVFAKGEKFYVSEIGWHPMHIYDHRPWIVWKGVQAMLDGTRDGCGSCRACCITLPINDEGDGFSKPKHRACSNLCNDGCGIYDKKPAACSRFECVWLKSQRGNRAMAPELRPDRCGVILTDFEEGPIRIHHDPTYPKSEAMAKFVEERTTEGEHFDDVTHYTGGS